MSQKYEKLKALLKELFQLDQPDLDFGLYRIMHAKSAEVSQFLDRDLLPQVKAAFGAYKTADRAEIEKELAKAVEQAQGLGVDPETTQKVKDLRAKLASEAVDLGQLESEVYDHLYSFFRRYYDQGDFLAKRVYKPGVYAIPYEGEEVTLHWANKDQYYIKTSEYLRDYAFRLRPDDEKKPMRVHFRLVDAAEGEHGNVKAAEGKDRVFILAAGGDSGRDFIDEADGEQGKELSIRFEYRPATLTDWPEDVRDGKTKPPAQKDLSADAAKRILAVADTSLAPWLTELGKPHVLASGEKADYTRLEAHLPRYTARNTFDYFIHKDLGAFLRRELDFYIKNEVMHLDDVENETAPRVEQYLSKIKVIRRIAGKIIEFLAQLEDFQKKLWLKKKFVVETSWCIRVGCIPESFYAEIAANEAQREEWVKLFAIDEIVGDLTTPGYTKPLTAEFLKGHPTLVVDTRHFDADFAARLLDAIGDVEEQTDGVLFHSENFQALSLMRSSRTGQVKLIYIDPPYNTGQDEFAYKDNYQSSSWLAMMCNRFELARQVLADDGVIVVQISDREHHRLKALLEISFPGQFVNHVTVKTRSPSGFKTVNLGLFEAAEYLYVYGINKAAITANPVFVESEYDDNYNLVVLNPSAPAEAWQIGKLHARVAQETGHRDAKAARKSLGAAAFRELVATSAMNDAANVFRLTAIDDDGASKETVELKRKSLQERGVVLKQERPGFSARYILDGQEISFLAKKVREIEGRRVCTTLATNIWADIAWEGIASEGGVTLKKGKKPERLIERLLAMFTKDGDLVADYFAGSGTTQAVATKMGRRFIGVEVESHFEDSLLPRLKRVLYKDRSGISKSYNVQNRGVIRCCRLESYEDTLNNLETRRTEKQQLLLDAAEAQGADGLKEQYLLRYMLDVETRGSQSLLNVQAFSDPTAYKLKVKRSGSDESREVNVDLLETFNWLIGLTVRHIATPQTFSAAFERDSEKRLRLKGRLKQEADGPFWFRTVTGTTPDGRKALVIWRKLTGNPEEDNLVLDEWFTKQGYSSKDSEFDLIYVNGGNNLENLKTPDDTWKVRLIEEDFFRLMFDTEGA